LSPLPARAQDAGGSAQSENEKTVEGTIVSSSRTTFVVRSDDRQFHLFTYERNTTKPGTLAVGARVRVVSSEGDQPGARQATNIDVLDQAPHTDAARPLARNAAPLPPSVRNVESQIKRDARHWRLGAQAGVALNPELILFGVHSQMGPIFSRNLFFRPNADFAWGEITDMVALNLEAIYKLPVSSRRGEWSSYVGGGPALNFIHQSFETKASEARDISFGNFDYETGFNVLMGIQYRNGTFFEVKTSLYSQPAPVLRLILGKNF
jgi:hypothetical protein